MKTGDAIEHRFSDRALGMKGSSTLKAAQAAATLREKGIEVIDLTVGEPDFETPEFIKEYAAEGLRKGYTKYTPAAGLKEFRNSISSYYNEEFGGNVAAEEIAASCGGKQGIFNAMTTLLNPGDEVILPRPYWVTFPEIASFCGAQSVYVDTEANGFILTADRLREAITDRTRLLIINSPNNPSGRVIPRDELMKIFELCVERGIYVINDECYLLFVYPPAEIFSAASLPARYREYVCVAGSFSKTYSMTGWRIGYTIANSEWTKQMVKLQSHSATHPTSFVQYACARALDDRDRSRAAVSSMLEEYQRRRDWFVPALRAIDGIEVAEPEGAFYAFIDVRSHLGERFATSAEFAHQLITDAHVVTTDGEGFGADGFLRLSYAAPMDKLELAVKKLAEFVG